MRTIALVALLTLPVAAQSRGASEAVHPAAAAMARIPAGAHLPLYDDGQGARRVEAFALDRLPVTRGDFLAFVEAHPQWRRDRVRPLFAERGYLADWPAALDAGDATDRRRPVTEVSWFAARAYCEAAGKRLPTTLEWEHAADADEHQAGVSRDGAFIARLLGLYGRRAGGTPAPVGGTFRNVYGVHDLHGLVWEWTDDFNSVLVSDDSRSTGARDHRLFCASGAVGATDPANYPAFLRYAMRAGLEGRSTVSAVGFRCAR